MIRQLARLARRVPAAGERAEAIAVYADAHDVVLAAADQGFEGVACIDDGARALVLYSDLWALTGCSAMRDRAEALLEFVLWMQGEDGRFVNFIQDWQGTRNIGGQTSFPGGRFWHARGLRGLAKAWLILGDTGARDGFLSGLALVRRESAPADVRALQALAVLDVLARGHEEDHLREQLAAWCTEIAACRHGEVLLDIIGQDAPHLWGHLQEGVLAASGAFLGRDDFITVARRSAEALLVPVVESAFDLPTVQPYGVAAVVYDLERLYEATGEVRYATLAEDARAWFDGRNPAGVPVYDRVAGRVGDGIDNGVVNHNSGAEANIVAAQALVSEVAARVLRDPVLCFLSARSSRTPDVSSAAS